jgi:gluconolactonase
MSKGSAISIRRARPLSRTGAARGGRPAGALSGFAAGVTGLALALALAMTPAAAHEVKVINNRATHPRGPAFIDGLLFYTENGRHTVNTWDGTNNAVYWQSEGCGPSAVLPLGKDQSDLIVTCSTNSMIARVGRDGKTIDTFDRDKDGASLASPSGLVADGKGGVYFTASGPWESAPIAGKIFHMVEDGTITEVADDLHYPSGLALGSDGRLYVAEREAGRVISFAIRDDNTLTDRRLFVRIGAIDQESGVAYPEGLAFGPDGNLYIGQISTGRILVVDPRGKLVKTIEIPAAAAPNLTFSPDGTRLYVTGIDQPAAAPYWGKLYEVTLD